MKKVIAILLCLAVVCGFAMAAENTTGLYYTDNNSMLCAYNEPSMGVGAAFALNFCLGWGIGSFCQGDITGGVTALVGEVVGEAAAITGAVLIKDAMFALAENVDSYDAMSEAYQSEKVKMVAGYGLVAVGGIVVSSFKIYSWIRPFNYAKQAATSNVAPASYTQNSWQVLPVINPVNEQYGLVAKVTY